MPPKFPLNQSRFSTEAVQLTVAEPAEIYGLSTQGGWRARKCPEKVTKLAFVSFKRTDFIFLIAIAARRSLLKCLRRQNSRQLKKEVLVSGFVVSPPPPKV